MKIQIDFINQDQDFRESDPRSLSPKKFKHSIILKNVSCCNTIPGTQESIITSKQLRVYVMSSEKMGSRYQLHVLS